MNNSQKEFMSQVLKESKSFRNGLTLVEIRYCEKLKQMKAGQVCSVCGQFLFLEECPEIQDTGICSSCREELDILEEIEEQKGISFKQEDLVYENK